MKNSSINAYQTRILQVVFGFVLVVLFFFAISNMMAGSFSKVKFLLALGAGGSLVFALNDRYWLFALLIFSMGITIPGLPLSSDELGCLVLCSVHFVRLTIRNESSFYFNRDLGCALPVLFWMFVVWILNPVGLAMMGSKIIGGRFYFDILLGAVTLFVLSSIRVSERNARLLFFVLLFGQCWSLGRGVLFPPTDPDAIVFSGVEPERATRYAFVGCSMMFMLLYSRWKLSSIVVSLPKMLLLAILSLLALYSGKRRAFGTVALVPFYRMILTGKERGLTLFVSFLAFLFLIFAVAGDGVAYRLPQSAKRILAVFVPSYSHGETGGFKDLFRREMREQARMVIRENPWFGRKGFAMSFDETAWIHGGRHSDLYEGHAYAGNWHSEWYAYAADFGIPCALFWLCFMLYSLNYAYRGCRIVTEGRYLPTCCLYYSLLLFIDATFSYTSGHSAKTTMGNFIVYGTLLAIVRGYKQEKGFSER